MRIEVLESISRAAPDEWNRIVGRDRLICRHEYLLAVEQAKINECRYFYPMVYGEDGRLLAHACLYFIRTELDTFAQGWVKRAIAGVRRVWPGFLVMSSVECGTPVALGNTISFAEEADRAEIVRRLAAEAEKRAAELGAGVVLFRDFYESEQGFWKCLEKMGYSRAENLPSAHLEIRWKTFEGYLDSMRSEYRKKIVHRMKVFRESGCAVRVEHGQGTQASELARLWRNVYDRAREYRREVLTEEFFVSVARHLPARSALVLAEEQGKAVGFFLLLFDDETLIPLFCGFDYERNREHFLFFNLYYETLRVAVEAGYRRVDLGITTLIPKMDLGARVVPLYIYLKHLNPALNLVVPRLFRMMTPESRVEERRVFKAADVAEGEERGR